MPPKRRGSQSSQPPGKKSRIEDEEPEKEDGDITMSQPDFHHNPTMGEEAETGIIEQVCMKNFMCHTRLEFNFCPQVNFIIGRNGSGKSAVLTAIVVGLGGKATVTNRGSAIKGFIKTGKQAAEVVVKLRNRGPDAFKPELYGNAVVVERRWTADGSSNYKLKSSKGQLVSTKREELAHLLDQFNIQVDNPVAILNQDTSRNFLHSKNAHDKYRFFLKATQLEQMKHDYVVANESKEVAQEILTQKEETLPGLEKEVLEAEQKYKALSSLKDLKDKVERLKNEMAWAIVHQKAKEVEQAAKELRGEEARTPKYQQKLQEFQDKVEKCTKDHKEIEEQVQAFRNEGNQLEPRYKSSKKALTTRKASYRTAQMEARKINNEITSVERDKTQILQRIAEIKNSAHRDYEAERNARNEKIASMEQQVNTLKATQKTTDFELEQFRSTVNKYKSDHYTLKAEEQDLRNNKDQTRRTLHQMEGARKDSVRRFGHWVPELVQRIEQAFQRGQFHQKPMGPIGAHLKLKDGKWALAVERCVDGLIHAFLVSDHHDEKKLEGIFAQVCKNNRKPTIITSKFMATMHDVSANRVRCEFPTVLDMLDFDDPMYANCLIDQRGIESVVLIEDKEVARNVMSRNPPRNCREAFAINGDQMFSQPTFRYYATTKDKSQFLTVDIEEDIRARQEDLRRLEQEHKTAGEALTRLVREINTNQKEERRCQTRINKIQENIGGLNHEIRELRNREDPAPVDVTTLEEEVDHYEEQVGNIKERGKLALEKEEQAKTDMIEAEHDFHDVENRLKAISDSADPIKEKLAHAENEIGLYTSHKKHYESKMKEHDKKVSGSKAACEQLQKSLEEDTGKAELICERIETRRTAQNLDSEVQQINKRIKTEEKNRGNHEEITRQYHETLNAYTKIKKEVTQLQNFLKALDQVMVFRQDQYFTFRRMIAMRAKYFFIVMLSNRQYIGKMNFNHQKETLELSVQPTQTNGQGSKDMRALSGGERSFSTVCFILSLWDAMESPFRCLDEFDVFMDMVNRRISMDMMMDVAKNQKGRQFIFLTPLDMSIIKMTNRVRLYRMPDPDRGQGVLPFTASNQSQEEEQEAS